MEDDGTAREISRHSDAAEIGAALLDAAPGLERQAVERAASLLHIVRNSWVFTDAALRSSTQTRALALGACLAPLAKLVLAFYMLLYLVETPAWCWHHESCGDPAVVPRSPFSSRLSTTVSRSLQLGCLGIFLAHQAAMGIALGRWSRWSKFGICMMLFAVADTLVAFANGEGLPPSNIYWSPLLRPLIFVSVDEHVQKYFRQVAAAVLTERVLGYFTMLLLVFLMWSWFGILMFALSDEGSEYFSSFSDALRNLFILFTTANFPDVMMLAYAQSRWVILYFASFLIMCLYVLFNVMLAATYKAYKTCVAEGVVERAAEVEMSLDLIFQATAPHGLSEEAWRDVFCAFCRDGSEWNRSRASALFQHLAKGDKALQRGEWESIGGLLVNPSVFVQRREPPKNGAWLVRARTIMSVFVNCVVILDLAVTAAQTRSLMRDKIFKAHLPFLLVHGACTVVSLAEMLVRFWALRGVTSLWQLGWRVCMDAVMALGCAACEIVTCISPGPASFRLLALFRVMRAERILWRLRVVRSSIKSLIFLVGTFRSAASACFITFYFYSTVGVQLFGGMVRADNELLSDTAFATAGEVGYYANNFNDFWSGVVVLFELMVVNNWFVIAEGLAAVLGSQYYLAWMFCISFYLLIHTAILNVLVTSVVENFERMVDLEGSAESKASGAETSAESLHEMVAKTSVRFLGEDELIAQDSGATLETAGLLSSTDSAWMLRLLGGEFGTCTGMPQDD